MYMLLQAFSSAGSKVHEGRGVQLTDSRFIDLADIRPVESLRAQMGVVLTETKNYRLL